MVRVSGGWGGEGGEGGGRVHSIFTRGRSFFYEGCFMYAFSKRVIISIHWTTLPVCALLIAVCLFMFVNFPCLPLPDFPSKPCIHGIYYTWYILLIICILIYTTLAAVRGIVRSIICIHKHLVVYRKKRRHIIYTCTYLYICTYVHTYLYI